MKANKHDYKNPPIRVIENIMTGERLFINNVYDFCRKEEIDRKNFLNMLKGKILSIGIYRMPGTNHVSKHVYRSKQYKKWIAEHPEDAKRDLKAEAEARKRLSDPEIT